MTLDRRYQGAHVQVTDARGDSPEIGRMRVRLKLAALGYVGAQHGIDASPEVSRLSVQTLRDVAGRYYEAITGRRVAERDISNGEALGRLKLAAQAYAAARHGVDSNIEIARAGLGVLCEAAIRYCEAMDVARPKPGSVTDPTLALDDGT